MIRRWVAWAALSSTVCVSGCIAPALDSGAFEQNAKSALESATSETSTARLALDGLLAGKATNAYADTVVTDSENAMGGIETSFGGGRPAQQQSGPAARPGTQPVGRRRRRTRPHPYRTAAQRQECPSFGA